MGALDDLIAQDEDNLRKSRGGESELDRLLAMDEARDLPSQDPEIPESPSFADYDPATKPPSPPDVLDPLRAARERMGGGMEPINRAAEAYVGAALPGAGKGAGLLKRAAVEGAEAMGMDAAHQADEAIRSPSDEPFDMRKAAQEVLMSGGFGALGGAAGEYIGRGAGAVRDFAGRAAAKGKNLVTGLGVRGAQQTAAMHGVDAIDENYGGLLDRYSPSSGTGKSAASHHAVVKPQMEAAGADLQRMAREIDQGLTPTDPGAGSLMPGRPGDVGQASDTLERKLAEEAGKRGLAKDSRQYSTEIEAMLRELQGTPGTTSVAPRSRNEAAPLFEDAAAAETHLATPRSGGDAEPIFVDDAAQAAYDRRRSLGLERPTEAYWDEVTQTPGRAPLKRPESFPELINQKSSLQRFGHSGEGGSVPDNAAREAAAFGGSVLKDEAARIVAGAKPELASRYVAQNQNFAELATLEELLRKKAAAESQGGDLAGILGNSAISGIVGAGAGAAIDDNPIEGAAKGGLTGIAAGLGLQGGATRTAIRQGGGTRLSDMGANMFRSIEGGASSLASKFDGTRSSAALAAEAAEGLTGRSKPPGADVAVGHKLVRDALKTDPSKLGPYAAMLDPNDPALDAKITNLGKEPMFRKLLRDLENESAQMSRPQSGITFSMEGE